MDGPQVSREFTPPLRYRTCTEIYQDGTLKVFHRTETLVFTHPDSDKDHLACEVCTPAEEDIDICREVFKTDRRPHKLDAEADELLARCADPSEFDALRRRGWPGYSVGTQVLPPCGDKCTICTPTRESVMASHRRARKGKK